MVNNVLEGFWFKKYNMVWGLPPRLLLKSALKFTNGTNHLSFWLAEAAGILQNAGTAVQYFARRN